MSRVRYFDSGDGAVWAFPADKKGIYVCTRRQVIEASQFSAGAIQDEGYEELSKERAEAIVRDFYEGWVAMGFSFVPHDELEQLEIAEKQFNGHKLIQFDQFGESSPHQGPLDFVNYRYLVEVNLAKELEKFFEVTGYDKLGVVEAVYAVVKDRGNVHLGTAHFRNLREALRCYQTNKGQ